MCNNGYSAALNVKGFNFCCQFKTDLIFQFKTDLIHTKKKQKWV